MNRLWHVEEILLLWCFRSSSRTSRFVVQNMLGLQSGNAPHKLVALHGHTGHASGVAGAFAVATARARGARAGV